MILYLILCNVAGVDQISACFTRALRWNPLDISWSWCISYAERRIDTWQFYEVQ